LKILHCSRWFGFGFEQKGGTLEEPAKNKKNAKERTKKQLDKHLLVENEYGTGSTLRSKGCVDGLRQDTESSDPLSLTLTWMEEDKEQ
jgi:hypothetical protein